MITETQTRIIVLQLTDELAEQLQPFLAGLDITMSMAHVDCAPGLRRKGDAVSTTPPFFVPAIIIPLPAVARANGPGNLHIQSAGTPPEPS